MRMSCNGCRVLRKGCSENCSIRPCLQWIRSPDSQGNATVFLAKFYGRAGLMNLINSGPEHLRPAIFRSLLFEACGRILNPIYGSVGLLWSGNWQLCQSAVEAVLDGSPIVQMSAESAVSPSLTTTKTYDIRHVSRNENSAGMMIHKVQTRTRFKRTGGPSSTKLKQRSDSGTELTPEPTIEDSAIQLCQLRWSRNFTTNNELIRSTSHESSTSQQSELNGDGYSRENESMFSAETVEASMVSRAEPEIALKSHDNEVELELTLGLNSTRQFDSSSVKKRKNEMNGSDLETGEMEMGIDYPA